MHGKHSRVMFIPLYRNTVCNNGIDSRKCATGRGRNVGGIEKCFESDGWNDVRKTRYQKRRWRSATVGYGWRVSGSQMVRRCFCGSGLLAMDVNDNAGCLNARVVWTFFPSRRVLAGAAPVGGYNHPLRRSRNTRVTRRSSTDMTVNRQPSHSWLSPIIGSRSSRLTTKPARV